MESRDGRGERGENLSPLHGETEALSGPRSHSPESSTPGESETPARPRGLMFQRCCLCNADMGSVQVAPGDPADGKVSHGVCAKCEPGYVREQRAGLGLAVDCEGCGAAILLDGACSACHVGHDGPRCMACGKFAFHRDDCADMPQLGVDGPAPEAGEPAELGDEDGDGFAPTHDDTCDCDGCCGDDVEIDGYHNDRDAGAKAFLTGLGLWSLPGGLWVALFMPYALLAMAGGR